MWKVLWRLCHIVRDGGDEYAKIGIGKSTGTKLISACGHIEETRCL
jgi:NADH:ubiquinone oxidoreductase subunit F (NADH-binding)